jgi:hypothetical protein
LLVASLGLLLQVPGGMLHGVWHGVWHGDAAAAEAAFIGGFVLPLVTGALSQLLPVWCLPGPRTPARDALRARLVRRGQGRALLFGVSGVWLLAGQWAAVGLVALAGLDFLGRVLAGLLALARRPPAA